MGSALDNVQVADNGIRGYHGDGLFLSVNNDGADVGSKAVGGHQCGDCHEGYAQLIGAVTAKVHKGSGAHDNNNIGLTLQLGHHVLDHALLGMESLGLQHDLLIGLHMHHGGQVIGVGIVYDCAEAGQPAIIHILVEVV